MNLRTTTCVSACLLALLLQGCGKSGPGSADTASTAPAPDTATAAATAAAQPDAAQAAAGAPTFQDLTGKPVLLTDYPGKKVFVNFWASWCAPCIKEIPSIARAATTLAGDNYVFLLASDESLDTIKNFLLDRGFTGNFIKLNGYVGGFGIDVMPTSVLYDEHGKVLRTWQGSFEWDSADMLAQIRSQQ